MIDELIKIGKEFDGHFTTSYKYGIAMGIERGSEENAYLQWIAKLGVYCEAKLKTKYPDMTSRILTMVAEKSIYEKDYNIIMGYLESVKELESK
jgi:hypothetical protein